MQTILSSVRRVLGARATPSTGALDPLRGTVDATDAPQLAKYVARSALAIWLAHARTHWSTRIEIASGAVLTVLVLALMPDTLLLLPIIPVALCWTLAWAALHVIRALHLLSDARRALDGRDLDLAEHLLLEAEREVAPLEPQDLLTPVTELGASILETKASVLQARMRLDEAAATYRAAQVLFVVAGRRDRTVETAVKAALVLRQAGRSADSIARLQHALAVVEGSEGAGRAFAAEEADARRGAILLEMVPALIEAGELVRAIDTSHALVELARQRSPGHLAQARDLQARAVAAALE